MHMKIPQRRAAIVFAAVYEWSGVAKRLLVGFAPLFCQGVLHATVRRGSVRRHGLITAHHMNSTFVASDKVGHHMRRVDKTFVVAYKHNISV